MLVQIRPQKLFQQDSSTGGNPFAKAHDLPAACRCKLPADASKKIGDICHPIVRSSTQEIFSRLVPVFIELGAGKKYFEGAESLYMDSGSIICKVVEPGILFGEKTTKLYKALSYENGDALIRTADSREMFSITFRDADLSKAAILFAEDIFNLPGRS